MSAADPITRALVAAIRHSAAPMVLTDPRMPDNPMTAVNAAFEALTGYAADVAVGRNCRFLQGGGSNPETSRRIRACLEEERGCIEWVVNYRADGAQFYNLLFISPVFDRDGRLLHFFGNQRDITGGLPENLPEYILGKSDMPQDAIRQFQALLLDLLDEARAPEDAARALERIVAAARRLDELTLHLEPATWAPHVPR